MTHSNRITLPIFLPTRQLSKLVDCWINLNGERVWGLQGCRQCQKTSAWVSKRVMVARSESHCERVIMGERTRIAARKDQWGDNSHWSKCWSARGHRVCVRPRTLSHLEACGKNNGSMCCCALFGYGYDTWMLHDDRTGFILQHKSLLHEKCRVKPSGRESKNVPNRTKVKVLFNLQAVLYYCGVFNLVVNYLVIIITPRNWSCK